MLDNFALLSGQISLLNRLMKNEKMPIFRNYVMLPLTLSPERDAELEVGVKTFEPRNKKDTLAVLTLSLDAADSAENVSFLLACSFVSFSHFFPVLFDDQNLNMRFFWFLIEEIDRGSSGVVQPRCCTRLSANKARTRSGRENQCQHT